MNKKNNNPERGLRRENLNQNKLEQRPFNEKIKTIIMRKKLNNKQKKVIHEIQTKKRKTKKRIT